MNDKVASWLGEQFGDDKAVIGEVYGEYLVATADGLAKARKALDGRVFGDLKMIAHALKGNALMVGDAPFVTAAIRLRDAAGAEDVQAAVAALSILAELDACNRG